MATDSSTLAWKIPWTEEPSGLQPLGSQSRTRPSSFAFRFTFVAVARARICQWGQGAPGLRSSDLAAGGPSCLCDHCALINSRLNLPSGAQGRSRELEPTPYKQETWGTERLSRPGAPQGPARFHHQHRSARTWGEGRFAGSAQHVGAPSPQELGSPAPSSAAIHPEFTPPPTPAG